MLLLFLLGYSSDIFSHTYDFFNYGKDRVSSSSMKIILKNGSISAQLN